MIALSDAARHSMFWLLGAVAIVGAFVATAGVVRTTLKLAAGPASRAMSMIGALLVAGGVAGAVLVASGAPGSLRSAVADMFGVGGTSASPAPSPVPEAETVQVAGKDYSFDPAEITVKAGPAVNVVFVNEGASPHTFAVPDLGFELKTDTGGRAAGALRGLKPGTYPFICTIPGHEQLGMKGTLVVT